MYQQVNLADHTLVGTPGPLPDNLIGLPDSAVANISAVSNPPPAGTAGQGWWPVTLVTPTYDVTAEIPDGSYAYTANVSSQTVTGTANLRALTSGELAANLAAAQEAKLAALSQACAAQIVGGYTSSALGSPYTYPSTPTDQSNMTVSVLASLLPNLPGNWATPFWCADSTGAWAMRQHPAAQIQQAGSDGKSAVTAAQIKNASLGAEVMAATTIAAVNAITW